MRIPRSLDSQRLAMEAWVVAPAAMAEKTSSSMAVLSAAVFWYAFKVSKMRSGETLAGSGLVVMGASPEIYCALMGSGIFGEAPVNEFGFVGSDDGLRHVGFVELMKREIDFAGWLHGTEQKTVNIRGGGFGVHFFRWQSVTHRACRTNDPSGEDAAVFAPVGGVENAVHEVVRVAGQDVDAFVRVVLGFQQIGVNATTGFDAGGGLVHGVIFGNAVGQGFVHGYYDGVNLRVGEVQLERFFEPRQLWE